MASGPVTLGIGGSGGAGELGSRLLGAAVSRGAGAGIGETVGGEDCVHAPTPSRKRKGQARMPRTLGGGRLAEKTLSAKGKPKRTTSSRLDLFALFSPYPSRVGLPFLYSRAM